MSVNTFEAVELMYEARKPGACRIFFSFFACLPAMQASLHT